MVVEDLEGHIPGLVVHSPAVVDRVLLDTAPDIDSVDKVFDHKTG